MGSAILALCPPAMASGSETLYNLETFVPPQCYTKTGADSNPCYVCHTPAQPPNFLDDAALQSSYDFAAPALKNHWTNLFVDRRTAMARITREAVNRWVREDNYTAWRKTLQPLLKDAYVPDLDLAGGFDADGFDRGGAGWRAIRYVPFPGTFWPTNGSTSDAFIRLPKAFRTDAAGQPSLEVYKTNLAILEANMKLPVPAPGQPETREVDLVIEPIRESAADFDLDGDKELGVATRLRRLPAHYFGAAASVPLVPRLYPEGTEFFHTVRYLDPAAPGSMAARMKEVRYSRKFQFVSPGTLMGFAEKEFEEKRKGLLKVVAGTPGVGYVTDQGWIYLGWIEDAAGALRHQSNEEQRFCLGCHSGIGVTRDASFALPRKLPGLEGWRPQSLSGMADFPSARPPIAKADTQASARSGEKNRKGHAHTYFERVGGGDEFRSNAEILKRFFRGNKPLPVTVKRAAPGGDRDLAWLLLPSTERAYDLNRAYMLLVKEQSFIRGRDSVLAPVRNVHKELTNAQTEQGAAGHLFEDGTLLLDF
jgi:hypothetical protein